MIKHSSFPKSKSARAGLIAPRRPRSKKEEQEFGLAKKEYVMCSDCSAVYFDKAWHNNLEKDIKHFKKFENIKPEHLNLENLSARPSTFDKVLRFKICPACRMKKDKTFEGELAVSLAGISPSAGEEIMKMIENSDKQAQEKDPMDRILWIEKDKKEIRVFTSENQLAVRIGKKLKSSIKNSILKITHSHEEDVIRVFWKL